MSIIKHIFEEGELDEDSAVRKFRTTATDGKECLRNNIVPFIIDEDMKMFYYRGLHEWKTEKGYLRDTCLAAQDKFKQSLQYFRIPYVE